jgi:hypothetical protein
MQPTRKLVAILSLAVLLVISASTTLAANNVIHTRTVMNNVHEEFPLLGESECIGGFPGTVTLISTYIIDSTEFVDGPNAGTIHLNIDIQGATEIVSVDPVAYPTTFSGTFRNKIHINSNRKTFTFSNVTRVTVTGSDGSTALFQIHGHTTEVNGETKVAFDKLTCIK